MPIGTPREMLAQAHVGFAYAIARRAVAHLPPQFQEDLVAEGVAGMVQASTTYRWDENSSFAAYAIRRIRGAIKDAQRASDPLTRGERHRLRALGSDGPPPPSSVDTLVSFGADHLFRPIGAPGMGLTRNPLWREVVAQFRCLTPLERKVLVLTFEHGLTLAETGRVVRKSESGVCRIRSRAIRQLRDVIEPVLAEATA